MSDHECRSSNEELHKYFDELSNWGRWGSEDELGTLNLITPEKVLSAVALIESGSQMSLAHDLVKRAAPNNAQPVLHIMQYVPANRHAHNDWVGIAAHGYATTHIDALCHEHHLGKFYNGFDVAEHTKMSGIRKCSVHTMKDGVSTRAVLLDIARTQGRDWLDAGERVHVEDLEAAEAMAGVKVQPGDLLILRVGLYPRMEVEGIEDPWTLEYVRTGIDADCLPWLRERDVALFGGDCFERFPSGYSEFRMPLHIVGLVAMGMPLLDHIAVEEVSAHCAAAGRWEFFATFAPQRLRGGTGLAVNPIAIF